MFRKYDGGIRVCSRKTVLNRNVFLTNPISSMVIKKSFQLCILTSLLNVLELKNSDVSVKIRKKWSGVSKCVWKPDQIQAWSMIYDAISEKYGKHKIWIFWVYWKVCDMLKFVAGKTNIRPVLMNGDKSSYQKIDETVRYHQVITKVSRQGFIKLQISPWASWKLMPEIHSFFKNVPAPIYCMWPKKIKSKDQWS